MPKIVSWKKLDDTAQFARVLLPRGARRDVPWCNRTRLEVLHANCSHKLPKNISEHFIAVFLWCPTSNRALSQVAQICLPVQVRQLLTFVSWTMFSFMGCLFFHGCLFEVAMSPCLLFCCFLQKRLQGSCRDCCCGQETLVEALRCSCKFLVAVVGSKRLRQENP